MNLLQQVTDILVRCSQPYAAGQYVIVPTLLSYENGRAVQAYVEQAGSSFIVSDGGNAALVYSGLDGDPRAATKIMRAVPKAMGLLSSRDGWITSPPVDEMHLATYIAMVAECSLSLEASLRRMARRQHDSASFKDEVDIALRAAPKLSLVRRKHFTGASNKQHTFDFAIELDEKRTLVLDAVVPDPNSINSAVVSHLDLKQAQNPALIQRIVYDDARRWDGSDLALLSVGATAIPFSKLPAQMMKLSGTQLQLRH